MSLNLIYTETFNPVIIEFFFTSIVCILLVFSIFLINITETSKNINNKLLLPIIIYSLLFSLIHNFLLAPTSITVFNGILIYDELTKFIHFVILICLIIYFIIQQTLTELQKYFHFENCLFILLSIIGMLLLCSTYNLIILYLAIELQSLSFYVLAATNENSPTATEASLKYFVLGAIGSGFILYGISVIYGITGTLNLGNIFLLITHINQFENLTFILSIFYAFLFLIIGILFKIGSAPFHTWLPDVYEGSPHQITFFLLYSLKQFYFVY